MHNEQDQRISQPAGCAVSVLQPGRRNRLPASPGRLGSRWSSRPAQQRQKRLQTRPAAAAPPARTPCPRPQPPSPLLPPPASCPRPLAAKHKPRNWMVCTAACCKLTVVAAGFGSELPCEAVSHGRKHVGTACPARATSSRCRGQSAFSYLVPATPDVTIWMTGPHPRISTSAGLAHVQHAERPVQKGHRLHRGLPQKRRVPIAPG